MRWLCLVLLASCTHEVPADTVIFGGTIRTSPGEEASAVAFLDGRVVALDGAALGRVGDATEQVDLQGGALVPGFHDAHTHLLAGSFVLDRLMVLGLADMGRAVTEVERYAASAPDEPWIVGYGWTNGLLDTADGRRLDAVTPDRPVVLINASGHSALVNSEALRRAGLSAGTPDPAGGALGRDPETGELNGLLLETAMGLVMPLVLDAYSDEALAASVVGRLAEFQRGGFTSVSEILASPGVNLSRPWIYTQLEAEGRLPLQVNYYLPIFEQADLARIDAVRADYDTELVRFAGAKIWVDGSLGSLEGWTVGAYATSGTHGSHGFSPEELVAIVREAEERRIPLKLHAMGDAAVLAVVDALEVVEQERGGLTQTHVIDHACLVDAATRVRMSLLGAVASMQPIHYATANLADWHRELEDWTVEEGYDWRGMLDDGVPVALGTDWPVFPVSSAPVTLWAATSNHGDRTLSADEALWGLVSTPALAVHAEGEQGCLAVGCVADAVWMSVDPQLAEPDAISASEVSQVWSRGQPGL